MKIILTGASGLLGSAFARAAKRRGHEVVGIVGHSSQTIDGLTERHALDLTDFSATERFILDRFPDAIVNCAAFSEADQCEDQPERSRQINVELPTKLALFARHLFASLIHISSEQVFDGRHPPYTRRSAPNPLNEYGRQKLESEQRVHDLAAEFATTLRLPLLNGNSLHGERSLHERLLQRWETGRPAKLFTDEIRQPCLADNAADLMVELCERQDLKGVYNWAGATRLSRYEMGLSFIRRFGLPESLIEAAKRGDDPRFASRQPELAFDLVELSGKTKVQPQTFEDQLDALIIPPIRRRWYNAI